MSISYGTAHVIDGPRKEHVWPYQWLALCTCGKGIRCNSQEGAKDFLRRNGCLPPPPRSNHAGWHTTKGQPVVTDERCPGCGGDAGDNWFDRSLCPCADAMHTRCRKCGTALDGCPFDEKPVEMAREGEPACPVCGYRSPSWAECIVDHRPIPEEDLKRAAEFVRECGWVRGAA